MTEIQIRDKLVEYVAQVRARADLLMAATTPTSAGVLDQESIHELASELFTKSTRIRELLAK